MPGTGLRMGLAAGAAPLRLIPHFSLCFLPIRAPGAPVWPFELPLIFLVLCIGSAEYLIFQVLSCLGLLWP